jgi:hypothetical protein
MNGPEKSDSVVVAMKPANKVGQPAAEWAEPRTGPEGNTGRTHTRRTQCRGSVSQRMDRVRPAAGHYRASPSTPEGGAVCPNWARTDLCRGRPAMGVPTAIISAQVEMSHSERW